VESALGFCLWPLRRRSGWAMKLGRGASAESQVERDPKLRLVLLYGPDSGLAHERAKALVTRIAGDAADPFRVADFPASSLKDEPSRLMDEAASLSLTGGRRAVWLREATDANAGGAIGDFLAHPMGDTLIVVEAGDLATRSNLRKLAEDSAIALAVACYHDSGEAIEDVVRATLARHRLAVSSDAIAYLADRLGNDRMVSRSELDKLALYMEGKPRVELEDAIACVGDHAALSVADAIHAAAEGDAPSLDRALAAASREGESAVGIVRQALRHFQRLHLAASAMAAGKPPAAAIAGLRPPVFKRDATRLEQQLRLWPLGQLGTALTRLLEIEAQTKSTGLPDQTICARGLLELARIAQRNRRRR
jgi:DNA polymerase-3 subunit delta